MIYVEVVETGDNCEAETAEDAVYAAGVMAREAQKYGHFGYSFSPTIRFDAPDGRPIRVLTYKALLSATAHTGEKWQTSTQ